MAGEKQNRRRFLRSGAAATALASSLADDPLGQAVASKQISRQSADSSAYSERSRFERTARLGFDYGRSRNRPDLLTPLQDSLGIVTPSPLHYEVSHGSTPPDLDPAQHHLTVEGLIRTPLTLSVAEIRGYPSVSQIHFLECAGNSAPHLMRQGPSVQLTHGFTSCSEWTGVPLSRLLDRTGLRQRARYLVAEGAEPARHTRSIPLNRALRNAIVAFGQNGEALRPENGYPLRLLIPGLAGFYSVKWLRYLRVTDEPHKDPHSVYQHDQGGDFLFELEPKSVITYPSGQHRLSGPKSYWITGLAWSGRGEISKVEVSTDGGLTYRDTQLQHPVLSRSHTRFSLEWNWDGREAVLQSRATDETGLTQPTLSEFALSRGLSERQMISGRDHGGGHFNVIQPWRVTADGEVYNAL